MVEPGMEPPNGVDSNFDNPDREMYYICIVSNAIAIPVTTVFMGLRLWARYRLSMKLQIDDSTFQAEGVLDRANRSLQLLVSLATFVMDLSAILRWLLTDKSTQIGFMGYCAICLLSKDFEPTGQCLRLITFSAEIWRWLAPVGCSSAFGRPV